MTGMRVHITYTVDVTDDIRREIRRHYGQPGLANRGDIKDWYMSHGLAMDQDLSQAASDAADTEEDDPDA